MADCDGADFLPRGWAMRKGHRCRLTREDDKECTRGRARYSQSVRGRHLGLRLESWSVRKTLNVAAHSTLVNEGYDEFRASVSDWDEVEDYEDWWAGDECEAFEPSEDSWSWASCSSVCGDEDSSCKACNTTEGTRWEKAQVLANRVALAYSKTPQPERVQAVKATTSAKKSALKARQQTKPKARLSSAPALPAESLTGKPQGGLSGEHERALSFAAEMPKQTSTIDMRSVPKRLRKHVVSASQLVSWGLGGRNRQLVHEESEEYRAVTDYFTKTLPSGSIVKFGGLAKLPKPRWFLTDGGETVMFHGCKSAANEMSILREGFQVSRCRSHGTGFGTWLAYNASYSNSGYVFQDASGWKHIFVCIASHYYTVLDNMSMRVVGQGCAYPQWLLTYQIC